MEHSGGRMSISVDFPKTPVPPLLPCSPQPSSAELLQAPRAAVIAWCVSVFVCMYECVCAVKLHFSLRCKVSFVLFMNFWQSLRINMVA